MSEPSPEEFPETIQLTGQPVIPPEMLPRPAVRPPTQRRGEVRWRCQVKASCQLGGGQGDGSWWEASLDNISATGLRVVTGRKLEVDNVLVIEPHVTGRGAPQRVAARIIHVEPARDSQWAHGCQLLTPLN
jgi:hypothetical protein